MQFASTFIGNSREFANLNADHKEIFKLYMYYFYWIKKERYGYFLKTNSLIDMEDILLYAL